MGFFTQGELKKIAKIETDVGQLRSNCPDCKLYVNSENPRIEVSGEGKKKILIVGDFPTQSDDKYGVPFAEEEGELLKTALKKENISFNKDCWKTYAVRCRTKGNSFPTASNIKCCEPYLEKLLLTLKPKTVIAFGDSATTALFGDSYSDRSIDRWRGYCIPDEKYNCNIIPLHSPSYVLAKFSDKNLRSVFDRDLKFALSCVSKPVYERKNYEQYVTILTDFKSIIQTLKRVLSKARKIAFDYETTGLKPFKAGHKIATIGFAVSPTKAFAFPYQYRDIWTENELQQIKDLWIKILNRQDLLKIIHNSKFEDLWTRKFFNTRMVKVYDTLMAEHILDNRSASTGLKFQAFVRFGVRPYDDHIKSYLEAKKGEFNTVEKAPLRDLLLYNGLDCIFSLMLHKKQMPRLGGMRNLLKAYNFFMKGNEVLTTIQENGLTVNEKYYKIVKKELTKKVLDLKDELESGREAIAFKKHTGYPLKITSNQHLGILFYEVLGKTPIYTAKGSYKTDRTTLESLKLPFVETLSKMKKYEKARGTYLGQFAREVYLGKMHPFFDLIIPRTYRSSSSRPNFQNLPKRDPEIGNIIRKGIIPSQGCILIESDFSGAEVITSATYHKDPTFIHDITIGDMHRDLAAELFKIPVDILINAKKEGDKEEQKRAKMIRFFAKNNWTFAQFYGDWFKSCADNLWENVVEAGLQLPDGTLMADWLDQHGIIELGEMDSDNKPTPGSFLEHCKEVEKRMWEERFPLYTQWKKDVVDFYQKYGYIENHFGFRFTGYMDRKQCTNFPIQSASFHLLVSTLIKVQKFLTDNNMKTRIVGQIHDSVVADVPKNEIRKYVAGVHKIVSNLKNEFSWLIIPMEIEVELSRLNECGGNFSEMKEFSIKDILAGNFKSYILNK